MTRPIQPAEHIYPTSSSQTPQEKQKLFEIQFLTVVLSDYVAVTGQDGSAQQQISKIKNDLASGRPLDQLAMNVNLLISQINSGIVSDQAKFPSFSFSTEGSQVQALCNFGLSLEKLLNTMAEKGNITWQDEEKIFGELSNLIDNVSQMTQEQSFNKLNGVIEEVNNYLTHHYQLPTIPFLQAR